MSTTTRKWFGIGSLIAVLAMLLVGGPNTASRAAQAQATSAPTTTAEAPIPQLTRLNMLDAMNGWAVVTFLSSAPTAARSDYLAHTRDGGQSWSYSALPSAGVEDIFALDGLHVWLVDYHTNTLWRTADGGQSWNAATIDVIAAPYDELLSFADPLHGWL